MVFERILGWVANRFLNQHARAPCLAAAADIVAAGDRGVRGVCFGCGDLCGGGERRPQPDLGRLGGRRWPRPGLVPQVHRPGIRHAGICEPRGCRSFQRQEADAVPAVPGRAYGPESSQALSTGAKPVWNVGCLRLAAPSMGVELVIPVSFIHAYLYRLSCHKPPIHTPLPRLPSTPHSSGLW